MTNREQALQQLAEELLQVNEVLTPEEAQT